MKKLPKNPAQGTRRSRAMLKELADSIAQPAMTRSLMSAEKRRQVIADAKLQAAERLYGKHSARMVVKDGWANFMTGLGMPGRDKRMSNNAQWGLTLAENVAEDLYAADALARRIVEILPNDACREWIEYEKAVDVEGLEEEFDRLQVKSRLQEAWIFGRLYGGGAIFINDGTPVERLGLPLRPDGLERIVSLTVLSRWELWAWATDMQRDISKPDFGLPERYHIYPRMAFGQQALTVHASRIIRFDGRKLPRLLFIRNNFWGDSVLTPLYEALGDYSITHHAVSNVLQDFRIAVHKISGLSEMVAGGQEESVLKRVNLAAMTRSTTGAMVLDKELDEFDMQAASLAGVAELVDKNSELLQARTDIPHSVLFNEAPGGARSMGSSGDHEEKNWYNTVSAQQTSYLKPRLDQIAKLVFAQKRGPFKGKEPKNWKYDFKPLWQLDDKAAADAYLANAQGDDLYIQNGVRTNQAVQAARFPEEALAEPAQLMLQLNTQQLQQGDDPNDEPTPGPGEAAAKTKKDPNRGRRTGPDAEPEA
jgi:phage-related protein (TIGR01555 family)